MRDVGIPMRDWTSAYRSPYWNHEYITDFTGAAADYRSSCKFQSVEITSASPISLSI